MTTITFIDSQIPASSSESLNLAMSSNPPHLVHKGSRFDRIIRRTKDLLSPTSRTSRQSVSAESRASSPMLHSTQVEQSTSSSDTRTTITMPTNKTSEFLNPLTPSSHGDTSTTGGAPNAVLAVENERISTDKGNSTWGRSWIALDTALQILYKTSESFPMLRSVIGTLMSCLQTLHVS